MLRVCTGLSGRGPDNTSILRGRWRGGKQGFVSDGPVTWAPAWASGRSQWVRAIKTGPEGAPELGARSSEQSSNGVLGALLLSSPLFSPSCPLMADSCGIFLLGFMFLVSFSVTGVSGAKFDEVIQASWASDHMIYDGELLKLKLDNFSGIWCFNACFFGFYCFLRTSLILSGSESLCFALHGPIFSIA